MRSSSPATCRRLCAPSRCAHALDTDVSRSAWFLDRARVLMEAGLLEEAGPGPRQRVRAAAPERANQDRAEAELARAEVALLQGNRPRRQTHSARARRDFRRRQSPGWQARADVTRWQAYLDSEGRSGPGGPRDPQRRRRLGRAPMDRQLALIAAEAKLALGHVDDAGILLRVGAPRRRRPTRSAGGSTTTWSARGSRARPATSTTAQRELRTGLTTLANQQARHHSLDLRTAMAVHGGRLARARPPHRPRVRFRARRCSPPSSGGARCRTAARRSGRRATRSSPTSCPACASSPRTSDTARRAPGRTPAPPAARDRATGPGARVAAARGWSRRALCLARRPPAALAQQDTAAVAFFVIDHRLGAVTRRPRTRSRGHPGPVAEVSALMTRVRADLDALAGRLLPPPLRQAVSSSLAHDLEKLDRLLLPTSSSTRNGLLVIPSRTLATAPWSLLPRRVGRPTTVALSATGWLRGRPPILSPRVSAMAGPGLALSGPEVEDVASTWPGGVAADSEHGSAAALAKALVTSDLVHIAAHGQHNQDNPLFSSIRMADGPLYAYDVPPGRAGGRSHRPVGVRPRAHHTAGRRRGPRAHRGVARHRGASVVSSVSRVDDTTAFETMLRYHRLLSTGRTPPPPLPRRSTATSTCPRRSSASARHGWCPAPERAADRGPDARTRRSAHAVDGPPRPKRIGNASVRDRRCRANDASAHRLSWTGLYLANLACSADRNLARRSRPIKG